MSDEKYLQFVANYEDWVAVKKLKITDVTDPLVVAEFLAGLTVSVDLKIEQNLGKTVDLKKLDAAISGLGFGKGDVARALEEINTRKISAVINEVTVLEKFQKNVQKELQGFCKAYATRRALKACGLNVDYSGVEIPALKRLKKSKG
ncbi:MAG: DUF2666 family protein [archaeon]|nr:DUF2666 family protein [archaeon]